MINRLAFTSLLAIAIATGAERPRIYITESGAALLSGEARGAETKRSLSFTGGTSPQNIEVMKAFSKLCPGVSITSNREKADYVVRFDHEDLSPITPFTKGNKVAVFDRNEDLVFSHSTRVLSSSVKGACAAITAARH